MKIKEIRAMETTEAKKQLAETRAELAKEKAVAAGGTRPENPGKIRGLRKNIARMLTIIKEKEKTEKAKEKQKKKKRKTTKRHARKTKRKENKTKARKTKARKKQKKERKTKKSRKRQKREVKKE